MDAGHIGDIQFNDLHLTIQGNPLQDIMGGNLDLQPTTPKSLGMTQKDLSAIEVHNVKDLSLHNIKVEWEGTLAGFYTHALHADAFEGLSIDEFQGTGSRTALAAIQLTQGKKASIRNASNPAGKLLDNAGQSTKMPRAH